ncbi:MAG: GDP-mannose 4,6-dehydratase, partial [Desulfobacterales bacterium]|nr:GDP-mannose 4,6-dehydratase [Desulfobacterales bacterium]
MKELKTVFITGGAGYIGAVLVPKLLKKGFNVKVIDLYIYGNSLEKVKNHPNLIEIKGDIRDTSLL